MLKFLQGLAKLNKPEQNLREEIINAVKRLAEGAKLQASGRPNGWILKGDESAAVEVQFGGRREFYKMLEALGKEHVDYRVIITSSNVKSMRIGEIKWILNNKYMTRDKWLIIDIEHKESPKTVNFMLYGEKPGAGIAGIERPKEPRRKKIFGKRGEHKEQD